KRLGGGPYDLREHSVYEISRRHRRRRGGEGKVSSPALPLSRSPALGLDQRQPVQWSGEQSFKGGHRLRRLERVETPFGHAFPVGLRGSDPYAAPVSPVHHFHHGAALRAGPFQAELVGKGILEGATGGVVALTRRFYKGHDGRKEQDKV